MRIETKYFGWVDWPEDDIVDFPAGLPAFEWERRFARIAAASHAPLVFLQSLTTPGLCFLALPVSSVDASYDLEVGAEDLALLGLSEDARPGIGVDVETLSLLSWREGASATVNLLAPVVLNLRDRRAVQSIRCDARYSCHHPLPALAVALVSEGDACS